MKKYAVIDIGTNSVLLLIAEIKNRQIHPLLEMARIPRLGEGKGQSLTEAAIGRTLRVIAEYREIIHREKVEQTFCFGTQILRQAENREVFLRAVREKFHLEVEILSGPQEAILTFLGTWNSVAEETGSAWAMDIGGGSVELIHGSPQKIDFRQSFPIGAVRLKEQFQIRENISREIFAELTNYLGKELASLPARKLSPFLIGIGGTFTTLAALDLQLPEYDFNKIDGYDLSVEKINEFYHWLNGMTLAQRRELPGMEKGREDIILPAILMALTAAGHLTAEKIKVSARGVRYGVLLSKLNLLPEPELEDIH